jgi:hypothetical protein
MSIIFFVAGEQEQERESVSVSEVVGGLNMS